MYAIRSYYAINNRYELFLKQKEKTEQQIAALQKSLERINYKCEYYRIAKEKGTTENIPLSQELSMDYLHDDVKASSPVSLAHK